MSETVGEQAADLIEFGIQHSYIKRDFELRNIMTGDLKNTDRQKGLDLDDSSHLERR